MRHLLFILCLLLLGCRTVPPLTTDVVDLPEVLKSTLPIDSTADFGEFSYTRISDTQAVLTRKAPPPVIRKCKNCFNQVDNSKVKDKSETLVKDKSKVKDNSETTVKDRSDHRINSAEDYSSWFITLVKRILIGAALIVALLLIIRYL